MVSIMAAVNCFSSLAIVERYNDWLVFLHIDFFIPFSFVGFIFFINLNNKLLSYILYKYQISLGI